MKRNLFYAGMVAIGLTVLGYYVIPHRSPESTVKESLASSETSETVEASVIPMPDAKLDPVVEILETIIVEQRVNSSDTVPDAISAISPTIAPAERMTSTPRPDADSDRPMPYAEEGQEAPASNPHRDVCPYSGRCPVPHISYPITGRMPRE